MSACAFITIQNGIMPMVAMTSRKDHSVTCATALTFGAVRTPEKDAYQAPLAL